MCWLIFVEITDASYFLISPPSGLRLGRETEDFWAFPIFFLNIYLASRVRKTKCARSRILNISNILNISLILMPKSAYKLKKVRKEKQCNLPNVGYFQCYF